MLQTSIDHDLVHNQTVLGAAIQTGSPARAERIAATTDLLVSRGVEASAAAKTATAMVGRAVGGQGAVIAFDTAFNLVALLFVFGAPMIIAFKIFLAKTTASRRSDRPGATTRSEEHTSELPSLMRLSYAVLCLKKKKT